MTSVLGGALAAFGWLPPHSPILLILGLAVILYGGRNAKEWRDLLPVKLGGSLVFFAIANRPLVSAYGWGGWVNDGEAALGSSSWWLMNVLWSFLTVSSALFWTAAFGLTWMLRGLPTWKRIVSFATIWTLIAEWLRSVVHWGFEWGFLGYALADIDFLRQWSSVGGVLLLSLLIAAVGKSIFEFVTGSIRSRFAVVLGLVAGCGTLWLIGPALEPPNQLDNAQVKVAAFQFDPPVPPAGTTRLGLAPAWSSALPQLIDRGYDLIVLPESISSHAVQLDDRPVRSLGAARQVDKAAWQEMLSPYLGERKTALAVGVEGSERGLLYNSTAVWSRQGLVGWQHKVHLVPFAEYLPPGWGFLRSQALTYYEAGHSYRSIDSDGLRLGSFICQEVQYSSAARALSTDGANILVSGGNDGVFADRRVAMAHHSMARVRATEVGRHLVRAMKNGVTSIISPSGEILGRSPDEGSALVAATISPSSHTTVWTRFGPWPIVLGGLLFLGVEARKLHRHP